MKLMEMTWNQLLLKNFFILIFQSNWLKSSLKNDLCQTFEQLSKCRCCFQNLCVNFWNQLRRWKIVLSFKVYKELAYLCSTLLQCKMSFLSLLPIKSEMVHQLNAGLLLRHLLITSVEKHLYNTYYHWLR